MTQGQDYEQTTFELIDEAFGKFTEDSDHPYGALPSAAGQWPEERAFARVANVHAFARITQWLVGQQGYIQHGGDAADRVLFRNIARDEREEYSEAIARLIELNLKLCPEMLSEEPVEIEGLYSIPYYADPRMVDMIIRAFERGKVELPEILKERINERET